MQSINSLNSVQLFGKQYHTELSMGPFSLTRPDPTRPDPWVDPTHGQLWSTHRLPATNAERTIMSISSFHHVKQGYFETSTTTLDPMSFHTGTDNSLLLLSAQTAFEDYRRDKINLPLTFRLIMRCDGRVLFRATSFWNWSRRDWISSRTAVFFCSAIWSILSYSAFCLASSILKNVRSACRGNTLNCTIHFINESSHQRTCYTRRRTIHNFLTKFWVPQLGQPIRLLLKQSIQTEFSVKLRNRTHLWQISSSRFNDQVNFRICAFRTSILEERSHIPTNIYCFHTLLNKLTKQHRFYTNL
jgi:hypothetical protein